MELKDILKRPKFLLFLILIFALFLRFSFFTGVNCSGDTVYLNSVESILKGTFRPGWNKVQRLVFIYPLTFFSKIFGVTDVSLSLYVILTSLGIIILSYLFGKMFFNKKAGLITAFLISFFPLNVIYGTRTMPDVPLAFFMGLSVFLFFKGERSEGNFLNVNKKYLFNFLSGVFLVLSYLVKPTGIFLILFYLTYVFLYKRKIEKKYLFLVLGALFVFTIEGIYYLLIQGDFLYHFKSVYGRFSKGHYGKGCRLIDTLQFYPTLMLNCCFKWGKPFPHNIAGYFYYFIFMAIGSALYKKERKSYPLIIWFGVLYLFLSFGSTSLTSYKVIGKESRYLTVFTLPTFLILGRFLQKLFSREKLYLKIFSILIITLLLATSVPITKEIYDDFNWERGACGYLRKEDVVNIYQYLKGLPKKRIYISQNVARLLEFYFKFKRDKEIKSLENSNLSEVKDAYVVVNSTAHEAFNRRYREKSRALRKIHNNVPFPWKLLKRIGGKGGNLNRSYNPKIYYVPDSNRKKI